MGFSVILYNLIKRENSTLRPSSQGATYSCIVKRGTGIVNPTIELNLGLTDSPANYNYAYIPTFNRYYFVEEWTFEGRLWTATLSCDVLATYKEVIGATSLYVLRSSAESDGNVIDTLYPTKTNSTLQASVASAIWQTTITGGSFILGIVSKRPTFGSLKYVVADANALGSIVQGLLDDIVTAANNFDIQDASLDLQLNLVDPLQYIKSCIYLPIPFSSLPGSAPTGDVLEVYNYDIPITGNIKEIGSVAHYTSTTSYNIPKHPQTQSRGNFVNASPYSRHALTISPFGIVELDTTITCNAQNVSAEIVIDLPTGKGAMEVKADGKLLTKLETQIGVTVLLSQVSRDYLSAAQATTNGVLGAVGSALWGDVTGAIGSAANGIADATRALTPRSSSSGQGGSYAQFQLPPRLDSQFFPLVDDDNAHNGRPYCKMATPASLGGYMIIQDGDVPTSGTSMEDGKVRAYLEGGFYYE